MAKTDPKDSSKTGTAAPEKPAKKPKPPREFGWHPAWRTLASLAIVFHLAAVFVAPWDLSTQAALPPGYVPQRDRMGREVPPPETLWQEPIVLRTLHRKVFQHYQNLLYLNHGYEFFAPDPNGSNLIRYRILDSGGAEVASGVFPDLKTEWPRLYYHRHMMLAAQTGNMGEESGRHYAQHLLRLHKGKSAHLEWLIHTLLTPQQVKDGVPLDDPQTFVKLADIQETFREQPAGSSGELPVAIPGGNP